MSVPDPCAAGSIAGFLLYPLIHAYQRLRFPPSLMRFSMQKQRIRRFNR